MSNYPCSPLCAGYLRERQLATVLERVMALAEEGMGTGETRDALNDIKWLLRDFSAHDTSDGQVSPGRLALSKAEKQ